MAARVITAKAKFAFRNGATRAQINQQAGAELQYIMGTDHFMIKACRDDTFVVNGNNAYIGAGWLMKLVAAAVKFDNALLDMRVVSFVVAPDFISDLFQRLIDGGHLEEDASDLSFPEFIGVFVQACEAAGPFTMSPQDTHSLDHGGGNGAGLSANAAAMAIPTTGVWLEDVTLRELGVDRGKPTGYGELIILMNDIWRTENRLAANGVAQQAAGALLSAAESKIKGLKDFPDAAKAAGVAQFLMATHVPFPLFVMPKPNEIFQEIMRRCLPVDEAFEMAMRQSWRCYTPLRKLFGEQSFDVVEAGLRSMLHELCPGLSLSKGIQTLATRISQLAPQVSDTLELSQKILRMVQLLGKQSTDGGAGGASAATSTQVLERVASVPDYAELVAESEAAATDPLDHVVIATLLLKGKHPAGRIFLCQQPVAMLKHCQWRRLTGVKSAAIQKALDNVLAETAKDSENAQNLGTLTKEYAQRIPKGEIEFSAKGVLWWSAVVVPYMREAYPGGHIEGAGVADAQVWMHVGILDNIQPIITRLLVACGYPSGDKNGVSALFQSIRELLTAITRLPLGVQRDGFSIEFMAACNNAFKLAGDNRKEVNDTALDVSEEMIDFVPKEVRLQFAGITKKLKAYEAEVRNKAIGERHPGAGAMGAMPPAGATLLPPAAGMMVPYTPPAAQGGFHAHPVREAYTLSRVNTHRSTKGPKKTLTQSSAKVALSLKLKRASAGRRHQRSLASVRATPKHFIEQQASQVHTAPRECRLHRITQQQGRSAAARDQRRPCQPLPRAQLQVRTHQFAFHPSSPSLCVRATKSEPRSVPTTAQALHRQRGSRVRSAHQLPASKA